MTANKSAKKSEENYPIVVSRILCNFYDLHRFLVFYDRLYYCDSQNSSIWREVLGSFLRIHLLYSQINCLIASLT